MISLRVTRNTRAKGAFIAAGTVLDETNSDAATMKEINASGKGEWFSDDEPAPKAAPVAAPVPEPITEPGEADDPQPDTEPAKKRGRPRKDQ